MRLLLAFIGCLATSRAQGPDVERLLQKVSDRYASITSYIIDIQKTRVANAVGADITGIRPGVNQIVIARSGNRFRYEVSGPYANLMWITNGEQTWSYRPGVNEYTVEPAHEWPSVRGPAPGLDGIDWEYVTKFRSLAGMTDHASLVKREIAPDRVCPGTTAMIKLDLGDSREPATEELRVDLGTSLVCQSIVHSRSLVRGTLSEYTTERRWSYRQLTDPIDPDLFKFSPGRAKLVKRFPEPSPVHRQFLLVDNC